MPPSAASQRPIRSSNAAAMQSARAQPRRGVSLVNKLVGAAAVAMSTVVRACEPGGWALGSQVLGLDDRARGGFYLYLCSGPERAGDFTHWIKEKSTAEVYVVNVDVTRGGYDHDLTSPTVASRLVELATQPECLGVLATIPCSTWSSARFVQPGPEPLRNLTHPEGIPDANGAISLATRRANMIAQHCISIATAAASHNASFIFENPPGRDETSQFAIPGREQHASLWTLPAMVTFASRNGSQFVHFDQCRTGADTQKTTQLLCSANVVAAVREQLGSLVCNHPPNTHQSIIGGDGFKTKSAENFTSDLNRRLATAFLSNHPPWTTASHPPLQWVHAVGRAILPFTNHRTIALASLADDILVDAAIVKTDPQSLVNAIMHRVDSIDDESVTDDIMREIAPMVLAVSQVLRNQPDNPGFKMATKGPEASAWWKAMESEMANFERNHIFEEIPEDSVPGWNAHRGRSSDVIEMMWALVKKYNELGELLKYKARGVIRGDMEPKIDARKGITPEQTYAPTVRHNTLKLLIAAGVIRAGSNTPFQPADGSKSPFHRADGRKSETSRKMRFRSFDVTAAFLQGESPEGRVRYVRPPDGFRQVDRRGVPIVWKLTGNCYGRAAAPRIWYTAIHDYVTDPVHGLGMTQSDHDPCYYFKVYPDGSRLDAGLYVDDTWLIDDGGKAADADLEQLGKRFDLKLDESPKHFLNMNIEVISPTKIKVSSQNYVTRMADRYIPDWRTRATVDLPSTERLMKAYDAAQAERKDEATAPDAERIKRYGGKVGALIYTSPCARIDACYTISRLARAITFATPELEACADECMVYMAQTAAHGITFDGHAPNAGVMEAYTDSDWAVGHSTSGYCVRLAGVAFAYSSKRQACIAMSSTEAEIIAASTCALEVVHFRHLLTEMGLHQEGPTMVYIDNSGCVELARDRKSCHRSRHVDRRYFKIRELVASGELAVQWVATDLNEADLLTKSLKVEVFKRHRKTAMNLP